MFSVVRYGDKVRLIEFDDDTDKVTKYTEFSAFQARTLAIDILQHAQQVDAVQALNREG